MPWFHCGRKIFDDVTNCPSCDVAKDVWTTKLDKTNLFALSKPWEGEPDDQAEALKNAAKQGAPFCEKCEEAKRAQEAERQVEALKKAAEQGAPFCEKCEEAKQRERDAKEEREAEAAPASS